MKILIIDDQELVVLSLEKCLLDLGYEVISSNTISDGIKKYDLNEPDLVIADINMPFSDSDDLSANFDESQVAYNGLEIAKYIKITKGHTTPVMILSGNTDEDTIVQGFDLGVDDYMKKPLSLSEIGARVKRLIGAGEKISTNTKKNQIIQNNCIGVVIPCYDEELRLLSDEFRSFVNSNLGYHLCFVNDGSKDNTLQVLEKLREGNEDHISIYDCEKNGGKAEAVRLGMLHLAKQEQFNYIGFLDADLSTDFEDFHDLVNTISNSNFKIVSGSRMARMGADITKESARAIISKIINLIIRKTIGMDFNDTQCGAKIMSKDVIENTFQEKFLTKWLFDVEIFMRMKKIYGDEETKKLVCEQPLKRWIHADGSKLSFKDSLKIVFQIGQIAIHYR
ncbi:glycosyltransferase [Flavobacterium degerlachei]|jgi:CheY-like chemotaxis protein|uniref:Response regulator receiver domain-containing protein n=1 Tax=Flavobacterium degerlachei TaxID=229203 RepID=A0A1H2YGL3_9FLAO|nr:glycosyltransferase [Flavobacterium degerlachei]SDX03689.1 Response regulator receiver domain-containing protein [Flavobacterium degerlachei]